MAIASTAVAMAVAVALATSSRAETAAPSVARVDDRTVVCATQIVAGVRKFSIYFQPWQPPSATQSQGSAALVNMTSGFRSTENLALVSASAGPRALARVRTHRHRCSRSKSQVPLSSRGLAGPPVRYQTSVDCTLPGRVLARARVVSDGTRVTRADVAVRMERSGNPIAYVRITESGSGAFWVSPRCD